MWVWAILVRSNEARETLCQNGIDINGAHIPLHLDNPYTVHRVEGERVIIKDWSIWENDTLLIEYFRAHPNVGNFQRFTNPLPGILNITMVIVLFT